MRNRWDSITPEPRKAVAGRREEPDERVEAWAAPAASGLNRDNITRWAAATARVSPQTFAPSLKFAIADRTATVTSALVRAIQLNEPRNVQSCKPAAPSPSLLPPSGRFPFHGPPFGCTDSSRNCCLYLLTHLEQSSRQRSGSIFFNNNSQCRLTFRRVNKFLVG